MATGTQPLVCHITILQMSEGVNGQLVPHEQQCGFLGRRSYLLKPQHYYQGFNTKVGNYFFHQQLDWWAPNTGAAYGVPPLGTQPGHPWYVHPRRLECVPCPRHLYDFQDAEHKLNLIWLGLCCRPICHTQPALPVNPDWCRVKNPQSRTVSYQRC